MASNSTTNCSIRVKWSGLLAHLEHILHVVPVHTMLFTSTNNQWPVCTINSEALTYNTMLKDNIGKRLLDCIVFVIGKFNILCSGRFAHSLLIYILQKYALLCIAVIMLLYSKSLNLFSDENHSKHWICLVN